MLLCFVWQQEQRFQSILQQKKGFVYVIEGKGTFVLEGEEIKMEPGVVIFMDANAKHSLKAEENTSFLLSLNN